MTALAAALSLQDKVEQYGSYAGVAAVFGLGILSLLYFAQAREVKRLREWAGRAPERAAELEARAIAAAEEKLAAPEPAPAGSPRRPGLAVPGGRRRERSRVRQRRRRAPVAAPEVARPCRASPPPRRASPPARPALR